MSKLKLNLTLFFVTVIVIALLALFGPEEKSLGAIQKGGRAPVSRVLRYGERLDAKGLSLLESDNVQLVLPSSHCTAESGAMQ